jgi:hypothetical protein
MDLTVAIFSYNRGDFLQNCADSVMRLMPAAQMQIYDDGSDDPATLAVLTRFAGLVVPAPGGTRSKHGGLYGNMQAALEACSTRFLLFLQDDMQIVRPVTGGDAADICAIFDADPQRAFLSPTFVKGERRDLARQLLAPLPGLPALGMTLDAPPDLWAQRYAYGDVAIADVGRLRRAKWRFAERENLSRAAAAARFSDMPFMMVPFAFFCPEVPVFRARHRGLAAAIARRVTGPGIKGFRDMTAPEVARLRAIPAGTLPVAEDYLTTTRPVVRRPFVYQDIKVRPWIAALHRIETALRKGRG